MTAERRKERRRERRALRNNFAGLIYDDIMYGLGICAPTRMSNLELSVLLKLRRRLRPLFEAAAVEIEARFIAEEIRRAGVWDAERHAAIAVGKALRCLGLGLGVEVPQRGNGRMTLMEYVADVGHEAAGR